MKKLIPWAFLSILVAPGCAFLSAFAATLKQVFLVFVMAGLGAWLGLAAGPLGAIVGAGVGSVVGCTLDQNIALRSGELQGSGARALEQARWNGKTAQEWAGDFSGATGALDWFKSAVIWAIVIVASAFLIWLHVRNIHNWIKLGYWRGVWWHGLMGNRVGTDKIATS